MLYLLRCRYYDGSGREGVRIFYDTSSLAAAILEELVVGWEEITAYQFPLQGQGEAELVPFSEGEER